MAAKSGAGASAASAAPKAPGKKGRPPGSKNKPKRGPGDNGPSEDDVMIAAAEMIRLNEQRDSLNLVISKARKGMQQKGIVLGVLDQKIKMLEWTPQEQKLHFQNEAFYAQALNMPAGDLLDLFDEREGDSDTEVEGRRWYNIGLQDGKVGRGWPDEPPAGCPPEHHKEYADGSEEGQRQLQKAIAAQAKVVALPTAPNPVPDDDESASLDDVPSADEAANEEDADEDMAATQAVTQ